MHRCLLVAGIGVRLECEPSAVSLLDERYAAFLVPALAHEHAQLEVHFYDTDTLWRGQELHSRIDGDQLQVAGEGLQAALSLDASRGRIHAPRSARAVDAILRFVLSQQLLSRGALLLHASAVIIDGAAWVFAGASGVGKSTIASTLPARCLCDEAVVVQREGEGGLRVHASPYWQATPGSAPMRGLVFPERGGPNQWHSLSAARVAARLMSCVGPLPPQATPQAMATAGFMAEALAGRAFALRLDSVAAINSFLWPTIAQH